MIPKSNAFSGPHLVWGKLWVLMKSGAYNIIKQVGNYSEIFERNVGPKTALKLDRGLNALWTNGGLMYPAPFRYRHEEGALSGAPSD